VVRCYGVERLYSLTASLNSPTCHLPLPSKPSLGAVETVLGSAIVPESVAMLRGRTFWTLLCGSAAARLLPFILCFRVQLTECQIDDRIFCGVPEN